MRFSERLRELRIGKGLSQIDVATAIQVSKQAYNNYEKGIREPDYTLLVSIAQYFSVSLDDLLGNSQAPIRTLSDRPTTISIHNKKNAIKPISTIAEEEKQIFEMALTIINKFSGVTEKLVFLSKVSELADRLIEEKRIEEAKRA